MGKKQKVLTFIVGIFFCTQVFSHVYVYQDPITGKEHELSISIEKENRLCTLSGAGSVIDATCSSFEESNVHQLDLLGYGAFKLNKEDLDEYDRRERAGELKRHGNVKKPMFIENSEYQLIIAKAQNIKFMNSTFSNVYRVSYISKKRYGGGGVMLFTRHEGLIVFAKLLDFDSPPMMFKFLVGE
ncbi:hypothetical protein AB4238_21985, partial [Shewanella sp. 10N.286.45.A1]|uniref:hypothetical protein n=1 Tax=Shewanella sp. 10N.286.45.A1 TaxID=3229694 RepID=UPI003553CB0F